MGRAGIVECYRHACRRCKAGRKPDCEERHPAMLCGGARRAHLVPGYLQGAIDRLNLGIAKSAAPLLPGIGGGASEPSPGANDSPDSAGVKWRA